MEFSHLGLFAFSSFVALLSFISWESGTTVSVSAPIAVIVMCGIMCFLGASFSTSQYVTICFTLMYDFLEDAERNMDTNSKGRPFMSKSLQEIFDRFGYIYSGVPPRDANEVSRIVDAPTSQLGVVHNCTRTELMRYSYVGQINDPEWFDRVMKGKIKMWDVNGLRELVGRLLCSTASSLVLYTHLSLSLSLSSLSPSWAAWLILRFL